MPGGGLEPPTRGFSMPSTTNEERIERLERKCQVQASAIAQLESRLRETVRALTFTLKGPGTKAFENLLTKLEEDDNAT